MFFDLLLGVYSVCNSVYIIRVYGVCMSFILEIFGIKREKNKTEQQELSEPKVGEAFESISDSLFADAITALDKVRHIGHIHAIGDIVSKLGERDK